MNLAAAQPAVGIRRVPERSGRAQSAGIRVRGCVLVRWDGLVGMDLVRHAGICGDGRSKRQAQAQAREAELAFGGPWQRDGSTARVARTSLVGTGSSSTRQNGSRRRLYYISRRDAVASGAPAGEKRRRRAPIFDSCGIRPEAISRASPPFLEPTVKFQARFEHFSRTRSQRMTRALFGKIRALAKKN